ncbi:glycosyltransferase family 2 protein [Hufsiella ginkgonis]|uniref:Glycosyltransferase n=1 Tax=Hufsiella ginkgonis TaxID=2695274 RepID=A0A7K1Y0A3_9SPHI|nr:glycosyltransferase [Hufsiella ginkgonis]MXV16704.1 glycosyltransferase [Hufsiella ginkgonis]
MVSAIILAYNRSAEVLITVRKLRELQAELTFDLEIIVVDNASLDDTSKMVSEMLPEVTLITRSENNGIAGWNDGFAIAKYKYLLVLDDDSHIESGLLRAVSFLEQHPEVGIIGFHVVDQHLKGDPLLHPEDAWKNLQEVVGFIGCGAIIRKEVYHTIGGFAPWLFIYTHEFEYSIRCLNAGYKIIWFESVNVIHRASNLNRTSKRLRMFTTRNEMAIVYKYFESNRAKYLFRVLVNNLKFIKREGLTTGLYVMQGALLFFKMRKTLNYTPVSKQVQNFYASNFWSTKPVFKWLKGKP